MSIKLLSPKNAHYLQMIEVLPPNIMQLAHQQYSVCYYKNITPNIKIVITVIFENNILMICPKSPHRPKSPHFTVQDIYRHCVVT